MKNDYKQRKEEVKIDQKQLNILKQTKDSLLIERLPMEKVDIKLENASVHPATEYYENRKGFFQAKRKLEQQQLLPDISFSYSIGSNSSLNENLYKYQIGVKIPLIFSGNASKIRASKIAMEISKQQAADYELQFSSKQTQLMQELSKYSEALKYYQIEGKSQIGRASCRERE